MRHLRLRFSHQYAPVMARRCPLSVPFSFLLRPGCAAAAHLSSHVSTRETGTVRDGAIEIDSREAVSQFLNAHGKLGRVRGEDPDRRCPIAIRFRLIVSDYPLDLAGEGEGGGSCSRREGVGSGERVKP